MKAEPTALHCDDLPIYRLVREEPRLYYTPGYLAMVAPAHAGRFERELASPAASGVAGRLRAHARATLATYRNRLSRPYAPTCLTLYLHDGCTLRCTYCVSDPSPRPTRRLELAAVRAAASVVIANCLARGVPFTVVCHGGGEPTLEPALLFRVLDELEAMAEARGVATRRYLATNGVMAPAVARRVVRAFDLIGLSCDGPPDLQASQRPLRGGGSSTPHVEATADAAHEAGTPLHVRTTVLPRNAGRLAEVVEYLCTRLRPDEIAAEPVYVGGRTTAADAATSQDAEPMVEAFLAAEAATAARGVTWRTSGSRLGEIHGPYCHVNRDVLQLVPGGVAAACFKTQDAAAARRAGLDIGAPAPGEPRFTFDAARVAELRRRLAELAGCRDCFNRFHCARSCPDACPALGASARGGFRCRFQRLLTLRRSETIAAARWSGNGTLEEGIAL